MERPNGERRRGWRRWSVEDAQRVLGDWRDSGLSLAGFARERKISIQRLSRWRARLQGEAGSSTSLQLIPATLRLPAVAASAAVTLHVPDGTVVEIADVELVTPAWVGALARELARTP